MLNSRLEKSGLPTTAAISGVRKALVRRGDHAAECRADHHAYRHIHYISAQNEFLESV